MSDATPPRFEAALAARLSSRKQEVLARWTRRVLDDPGVPETQALAWPVLVDEVPRLLDALIDTLAACGSDGGCLSTTGVDAVLIDARRRAEVHARGRFSAGYSTASVLREISHLRVALIDVCFDPASATSVEQVQIVHTVLDEVMGTGAVEIERSTRAALEHGEAVLRLATQAGGIGVWDYDLATGEMRWDLRCREIVGVPRDVEITYDHFLSRIHPDDRARVEKAVQHSWDQANSGEYNIEYRFAPGSEAGPRWVNARGRTFFDASGRAVRMIGTVIDISDRKRAEAARIEELAFRDRFMAALGHYLRTPLTSITLSASMLTHQGTIPPRQRKIIDRISVSARRMARTIDDLVELTRSRMGGRISIDPKPADLHAICKGAVDDLRVMHPVIPIRLDLEGSGEGLWDADRLAQLVSSLVQNALDYSITGSPVQVTVRPEADALRIEVHNQGPAIAPEVMANLFDPFRLAPGGGRASSGRGLGLGLFIAHQIAEAHGGSIDVVSTPEQGTTFGVRLPRRSGA